MLRYNANLRNKARQLRKNLTYSESALWARLRNKQFLGVQFYRQKPIGEYIVDFYAPRAKLVVKVGGSQHTQGDHVQKDRRRDEYLASLGLNVLHFNSREVSKENDSVVEVICRTSIDRHVAASIPSVDGTVCLVAFEFGGPPPYESLYASGSLGLVEQTV